jgi:hypothetical protein
MVRLSCENSQGESKSGHERQIQGLKLLNASQHFWARNALRAIVVPLLSF